MSSSGTRLPRALTPFATPQYRLLASGLILAMFADGVWTVALVWQVIALGGGPVQVSLATGAAAVGVVLSTLAGGVLADRVAQRSIMIGLETVKMIAFGVIGVASLAGVLDVWLVVVAAILGGVTTGMYYPAYSALLPKIVSPSELQAANGIEGMFRPVVFQALGPMAAGAVIGAIAPGAAVVMAALAAIASAGCYLAMTPIARVTPPEEGLTQVATLPAEPLRAAPVRGVVTDLSEGFAYLWRTPWLWSTLFFACLLVLAVMGPIEVLVPFALQERVDGNASDHALVLAGFGAGAALASLVFASMPMPRRYLTVMFVLFGLSSLPLVIIGVAEATWLFVLAGFLMGVLLDGPMVLWGTLLQRRVPAKLLGRVASLDFFVSVALMPVSMALAAPVSHLIGLTPTFIVAGLLPVPIAVVFYLAARLWRDEVANPITDEQPLKIEATG